MRKETITCDTCGTHDKTTIVKTVVVFTTEQDEGRSTTPYLESATLDLCETCKNHMLETRTMPTATGAMGYNSYSFHNKP
jgi:hypothetical protein